LLPEKLLLMELLPGCNEELNALAPPNGQLGDMRQSAGAAQRVAVTGKVWLVQSQSRGVAGLYLELTIEFK
jgi:hypothetical protein